MSDKCRELIVKIEKQGCYCDVRAGWSCPIHGYLRELEAALPAQPCPHNHPAYGLTCGPECVPAQQAPILSKSMEKRLKAQQALGGYQMNWCSQHGVNFERDKMCPLCAPAQQAPDGLRELAIQFAEEWFERPWRLEHPYSAMMQTMVDRILLKFAKFDPTTPAASASAPAAEYPHLPICNGDRRFPAGVPGHCCCCLNIDMQMEARKQRAAQPPAPKVDAAASMLLSQKCIWSESMQGWIAPNKRTHDNLVELFNRLAATPGDTPPASDNRNDKWLAHVVSRWLLDVRDCHYEADEQTALGIIDDVRKHDRHAAGRAAQSREKEPGV